jgi:ATP-binding cassette subfamily B protein
VLTKIYKLRPLWQSLSKRRRRQLYGLQILSLVAAVGEVANLGALLPFLRLLANPKESLLALGPLTSSLSDLPEKQLLVVLGLAFCVVVVLSTSIRTITIRAQLLLAALIASDLGEKVFSAVLYRPFSWHLEHNSSKVISHLTKDVNQTEASIRAVLTVVVNMSIVLLLGISLIALAPSVMLLIVALLAGFYLLVFRFTRATLRADGQRVTTNFQASLQVAQEGLGGIRDVLLDRRQPFFLSSYKDRNRDYRLANAAINIKAQIPRYLIEGFSLLLIIGLSLNLALSGQGIEKQLPLLGTISLGAYRLLQPLQQCFAALSAIQANQASLIRLQPFLQPDLDKREYAISRSRPVVFAASNQSLIELRDLSFRYNLESPMVLNSLNFDIQPGERIAFVGRSGSGKSTISDLILGLLRPTKGQILVHGEDLYNNQDLVGAWQDRVAHVPQHIYLSDSSFASNIAFGLPFEEIDHQRVRQAAINSRIADVIQSSPEDYSTVVGERGVRLSGGQRQRIGLARALYKNAELLVLDEATSALDNRTELEVMEAVDNLDRKITVILIAHRLSTVQGCDRILFLEKGNIAGLGSYAELLESNQSFQRLARDRSTINV